MSLLTATLVKESDYQPLALTTEDKAKGVSQRMGYRIGYNQMIAEYLLFFHVNERYLKSFINPADFAKDDELLLKKAKNNKLVRCSWTQISLIKHHAPALPKSVQK